MTYREFLASKTRMALPAGFSVEDWEISQALFPFQRDLVRWACRLGRAAIFADTGLGKGPMTLEWCRIIHAMTGRDLLILAPLAVASQLHREGIKFGIPSTVCRESSDVTTGINIANYDRLHKFDPSRFVGVALDESSCLKNDIGKMRTTLVESFSRTPYRLCCTATPAPNDFIELGNHAEFLGIMPIKEMKARWFVNNSGDRGNYALKRHGVREWWRWVASWGVCVTSPEDLGHDGSAYVLPPLDLSIVELSSDSCPPPEGYLFHARDVSATGLHSVKRATAMERARALATEVNSDAPDEPWLIWSDANYEADAVRPLIPGCVEVRGSDSIEDKESRLLGFAEGSVKRLLSKPEIAGAGMNFQHCNRMAFMGASFSFERYYQAIRRCHRYGQTRRVKVRVYSTDAESSVLKTMLAKESAFLEMRAAMVDAVREDQLASVRGGVSLEPFDPGRDVSFPAWMRSHA